MKRRFHSTDVPGYLIRRHLNALQKMVEDFAPTLIAAVTAPFATRKGVPIDEIV